MRIYVSSVNIVVSVDIMHGHLHTDLLILCQFDKEFLGLKSEIYQPNQAYIQLTKQTNQETNVYNLLFAGDHGQTGDIGFKGHRGRKGNKGECGLQGGTGEPGVEGPMGPPGKSIIPLH